MAGYPALLSVFPVKPAVHTLVDVFTEPFDKYLAYAPMPGLVNATVSYGVFPCTELSAGLSGPFDPGLRLGGKTLLLDSGVRFAADYGVFVSLENVGADAGFLASVPAPGVEFYSGLRGFGIPFDTSLDTTLAGAFTLGGAVPVSGEASAGHLFLEFTLLASGYSGTVSTTVVQPVGFSLMPAIGVTF